MYKDFESTKAKQYILDLQIKNENIFWRHPYLQRISERMESRVHSRGGGLWEWNSESTETTYAEIIEKVMLNIRSSHIFIRIKIQI